jgi:serine/threonine protein kinase
VSRVCPTCQITYDDDVTECPLDGTSISKIKKIAISPDGEVREGSLPQEPSLDQTTLSPQISPKITALALAPSSGKIPAISAPQSGKFGAAKAPQSETKIVAAQKPVSNTSSSGKIPAIQQPPSGKHTAVVSSAKVKAISQEEIKPAAVPLEELAAIAQKQMEGKEEEDETLPIGTRCGEYQIEAKIGEGGMGIIYRAIHPLIGKQAAVKVLRRELCHSSNVVSRFLVEAMAVNKIKHPNTVDIFSFGQLPDGRHFLIMEFLDGKTLEDHLKAKGRLNLSESLVIFRPLVSVLSAAHTAGIVHRDLKPENVFLANNPEGPFRVKLLDFGIAKLIEGHSELSHKTSTGMMMGTPYYMAPEQILGHKNIDARADQYSLGIILYQMLSGELPFSGKSLFDVASKHVQAKVPDLPPLHGRTFSQELFDVIEQALAKRPESRFANVKEFLAALESTEPNSLSTKTEDNLKATRAVDMLMRAISATIERTPSPSSSPETPALPKERKMGETVSGSVPRVKVTGGLGSTGGDESPASESQELQRSVPPQAAPEIPTLLRDQPEVFTPPPAKEVHRAQPVSNPSAESKRPDAALVPKPAKGAPIWVFVVAALVTGAVLFAIFAIPKQAETTEVAPETKIALPELKFVQPAPAPLLRGGSKIPLK